MSCIGKNIKKIRSVKKINQADFADLFNLARASVGSYEEGRAEPKIDTVIAIANHFGISIDLLLKKELTVNELYRFDIFKPELQQSLVAEPHAHILPPTVAGIPLLTAAHTGEYILQKGAAAFVGQLPQLHLPFLPKGNYRAFEVMDSDTTFHKGDVVIGQKLSHKEKPEQGLYYIVLTPTKVIINQTNAQLTITEEIVEKWEVTHSIAAFKPIAAGDLEERLARLERLVEGLIG